MKKKNRILFLCTGNSARSQMAEAFLRHYAGNSFDVYSAGLEPKVINQLAVQVMAEVGIDVSNQTSKSVSEYLGRTFIHTLVTVCDNAEKNCPSAWPGIVNILHWSFEDPATFVGNEKEKLEKFREIRNQINQKIQSWLLEQSIEFT